MVQIDPATQAILDRYGSKLGDQFQSTMDQPSNGTFTKDYESFRNEALRVENSLYERACNFAGSIIELAPSNKEQKQRLAVAIESLHLNITPAGAYTLAVLIMCSFVLLGILIAFISFVFGSIQILIPFLLIVMGVGLLIPLSRYPIHLAQRRRLKASNQMVLCILYIVIYMRHTSNLEHALKFAGEHIGNPLALDLRKVIWDVEIKRYPTVQDSLENFLSSWKDHNLAFVESFHLIEASLFEGKKSRRIELLEKSLSVILEGTYDSMLHYAQQVKTPMTMLHMLGVILPILGLIILPLVGSFMGISWFHIFLVYNLILPFAVFYMGYTLLAKRPIGYSQTDITTSPQYEHLRQANVLGMTVNPKFIGFMIGLVFILFGLSPLILHFIDPTTDIAITENILFLDYRETDIGTIVGPFGLGATLISLLVPIGVAFGLGTYYSIRSKKLIKIREQTKKLETEFRGAIFQLGNRIGGGMPAEMAFGEVSRNLKGTPTAHFLGIVDNNIRTLGMNLKEAIFNERNGAIVSYPSSLIESSMKVLVESARKGPGVVSRAMLSIANYLDRIYKVSERLKDLLSEITSSMKSQVAFLTPLIAGIVVGIGSMITTIITSLGSSLESAVEGGAQGADLLSGATGLANIFPIDKIIPPFYLQIIVGLYVVEMIIVLTILANGIENGVDKLNEEYTLGKNLYRGTMLYVLIAGITIFGFNILALTVGKI
jgi:Flp pilus assembly protein TadB